MYSVKLFSAEQIGIKWRSLRRDVNVAAGPRSYALIGPLAVLQEVFLYF